MIAASEGLFQILDEDEGAEGGLAMARLELPPKQSSHYRQFSVMTLATSIPSPKLRGFCLFGFWILTASIAISVTPIYLEGGYDVTEDKIKAALIAPLPASLGINYLISTDHRVTSVVSWSFVAFFVLIGLLLIFCRGRRVLFALALLHLTLIPVAFLGFYRFTCYWNDHGHG